MSLKDTTVTNSSKSFKFGENVLEITQMKYKTIPCIEGDDGLVAQSHLFKIGQKDLSSIDQASSEVFSCDTFVTSSAL